MVRRIARGCTIEQLDAWCEARRDNEEILEITAEEGGPRVSMVPSPTSVPLDFLPDAVDAPPPAHIVATATAPGTAVPFDPEPSRKTGGWSADRQRAFVATLAETGTVHLAAKSAGLSARSAYGLRIRSPAFAAAWDMAQTLAVGRLSALAFDRAIHGRIEQVYAEGTLVAEKRVPSERLLMWLLARLDPKRFAAPWERAQDGAADPQRDALTALPAMLGALTDTPSE